MAISQEAAQAYLAAFKYRSVEEFQRLAGLEPDGIIGEKTARMMQAPRCGCTDEAEPARAGRNARDPGRDYGADPIIYSIAAPAKPLTMEETAREFQAALDSWAAVCGVAARPAKPGERAELEVLIKTRRNDRTLDGPGRTLAYATIAGGLIVFDGDETWRTANSNQPGTLFRNVAAHEFGHTLGFYHSRVNSALMAPIYSPRVPAPVSPDDVERGRRAYGQPATTTKPPVDDGGDDQPADGFTGRLSISFKHGRVADIEAR